MGDALYWGGMFIAWSVNLGRSKRGRRTGQTYTHVAFGSLEGADDAFNHLVDVPDALQLTAEGGLADFFCIEGLFLVLIATTTAAVVVVGVAVTARRWGLGRLWSRRKVRGVDGRGEYLGRVDFAFGHGRLRWWFAQGLLL